jgi:Glycerol-3-phosphate dehydrogenase
MPFRNEMLTQLDQSSWDLVVVGGGATGLGTAVDAASRGLKTLLLEQGDFAQATSSRSTKLIHGGVRYLKQGNVSLVRESLHERGLLLKNAPGLVRPLEFVIPTFSFGERLFYAIGLKAYDFLAGRLLGMPRSRMLSNDEMKQRTPTIRMDRLRGGVSYYDAQFDDARLAIAMATLLRQQGGLPLNYMRVEQLRKEGGRINGVVASDMETGRQYKVNAKVVVNATGIFTDFTRALDDPRSPPMMRVSRGSHIVVDRSFLPGNTAIILPSTDDGRVLFIIPWHGAVLIGTTDLPEAEPSMDPIPLPEEIDFMLTHASRYLDREVTHRDIRSMFCGLRPLVSEEKTSSTSRISRDHVIRTSESGLITITGGKWTTYRRMAADTVDHAISVAGLAARPSLTETLPLSANPHDLPGEPQSTSTVTDEFIRRVIREEQARTIDDILSRRCRLLLLDAGAALKAAPRVASILAEELGKDSNWARGQVATFTSLATGYLPDPQSDSLGATTAQPSSSKEPARR